MARKPFKGSVAENVLEHGVGGINIDECRVGTDDNLMGGAYSGGERKEGEWKEHSGFKNNNSNIKYEQPKGRYPANVIHDGFEVVQDIFGDKARYFYCPKASKKDRDEGLNEFQYKQSSKKMKSKVCKKSVFEKRLFTTYSPTP